MNNSTRSVLVVTSEFPPMPGGIGNHAFNLCIYLSRNGYDVTVLTNKRSQHQSDFNDFLNNHPDLKIIALDRKSNLISTYLDRIKAYRKVLQLRPSCIFFSGKFSIWLAGLGWHNAPSWAVIHGSEIQQEGVKRYWFKRGLSRMHGIISVSSFTYDHLISAFPSLSKEKCVVINNGFDFPEFATTHREPKDGECHLITVGGMHRRKGQHNIIAALPTIRKQFPSVKYTIAGLPESMNTLMELANTLGVADIVNFVPNPSRQELVELLQSAHIFAMLSENLPNGDIEGFGIAILEGMSLGLPAIGSKNSGIRDAIDHQHAGWLIEDIHQPEEIGKALATILANYAEYSNQAKLWSARFRWSNVITQYLKAIEN